MPTKKSVMKSLPQRLSRDCIIISFL